MRTVRARTASWSLLLVALLTLSACFAGEEPKPKPPGAEWLSSRITQDLTDVVIEKVTYRSGDLTILGQVCRPADPGPHPVLIFNHGGFAGLGEWDDPNGLCWQSAKEGWAVAESSYRGEDGSGGDIEVCLGEVDDTLAMLDIMREQTYADPDRIAMLGVSHGGCVTSRAVERGVDVDVAVDIAGPSDWGPLLRTTDQALKRKSTPPGLEQIYKTLGDLVETAVGGRPGEVPERYAQRSPDPDKVAQWDHPFLIMHGVDDSVVPVQQSCKLARQAGGFQAHRYDTSGNIVRRGPPGCGKLPWADAESDGANGFEGNRYLLVYDKVDHFIVDSNGLNKMVKDLFMFLEAKMDVPD